MTRPSSTPTMLTFVAPAYLAEPEPEPHAARDTGDAPTAPTAPTCSGSRFAAFAGTAPEPASDEPAPPGKRLASALAAALRAHGWHVDYTWTTYTGHALDARRVTDRYDVELTLSDVARAAWRLTARRRTGLMQNIFRRRPRDVEAVEHQLLRAHLEEALRGDPDVVLDEVAGAVWRPEPA